MPAPKARVTFRRWSPTGRWRRGGHLAATAQALRRRGVDSAGRRGDLVGRWQRGRRRGVRAGHRRAGRAERRPGPTVPAGEHAGAAERPAPPRRRRSRAPLVEVQGPNGVGAVDYRPTTSTPPIQRAPRCTRSTPRPGTIGTGTGMHGARMPLGAAMRVTYEYGGGPQGVVPIDAIRDRRCACRR